MKFKPREYQKTIIRHIVAHKRCAVLAGMGMGKTSSTLCALDYIKRLGLPMRALVIAPLRVAVSTWPDELLKWDDIELSIVPVVGTVKERERAINKPADVHTINYEALPWLIKLLGDRWPFNVIVADESTRLKSFRLGGGGSTRAKALSKVAFQTERFIELTGTPAPNGLIDLWGQMYFIDHGERLERSFGAYTSVYFNQRRVGASAFAVAYEPCEWAQARIQGRISDVCVSLNASDYFPLRDPIVSNIYVTLPAEARRVYDDLQRTMIAELAEDVEIDAVSAATKSIKCLQVASGTVYDDAHTWHYLHDTKIEALKSIVEESAGAPVLVAYHWRSDLDRLLKAFPAGVALDKDPAIIRRWNAGKIPILFVHPASAGHGLNLQDGGNILVFFSHWWDLEQYQQIVERIGPTRQAQAGHNRSVFIYHIVARDTIDELVIERRDAKKTVQEILLEHLKYKK